MEDYKLKIPSSVKYINEVITELPHNCLFNKGIPGCGGTTIALTNEDNYVICVPFVSLIENKCNQYPNVLGVFKGVSVNAIKDYLSTEGIKKIIVTYDSLIKVVNILKSSNLLNKFNLLVDEYHLLFTQYSFRHEAVMTVLNNYDKFKYYCFMTATPVENEFILEELKHINSFKVEWETTREITVDAIKCNKSTIPTVSNLIHKHLTNEIEGNAYFFVNSVEYIKEIVKLNKLNDSNTRAVWSKHNKLNPGITLGASLDNPKKINFFTSTCFEGNDIYDENGIIYVISDGKKLHTLLDISTSLQQIAGRIRNTKYWDKIYHFYTTTRYDVNVTYDEYKEIIQDEIVKCKEYVEYLNNSPKGLSDILETNYKNSYIMKRDNRFIFDENLVKVDLFNFKITKCIYKLKVALEKEYSNHQLNINSSESIVKDNFKMTNNLREVIDEILTHNDADYIKWAYSKYDYLESAIKFLGYDKLEELNFKPSLIKKYLIKYSHLNENDKIKKSLLLYSELDKGNFVSFKRLKMIFCELYKSLNINKTCKSTDILEFRNCRLTKKLVDGKSVNGYFIIR